VVFSIREVNRRRGCRRGGSAAELALVAPVLVFILLFTIDFCRVFFAYTTITNAARNGALWASDPLASTQSPYASLQAAALAEDNNLNPTLTSEIAAGTGSITQTAGTDPNTVMVTVSYQFPLITSYLGMRNVSFSPQVTMRTLAQTP
jgi:Flp pilus assembly protein TadG